MMYCPYAVHRKSVTQLTSEYDSEGRETGWQKIETNSAVFVKCVGEQCGAWQDEKCQYKGCS